MERHALDLEPRFHQLEDEGHGSVHDGGGHADD